jgi:uncharacterized membrane protein
MANNSPHDLTEPASSQSSLVGLQVHSGPLPPPSELAAYERAYPGTAERVIVMAELEQKAELRDISFIHRARFVIDLLGQFFLYSLVAAAVYLAINDKPLEAFFAGLGPIVVTIYANIRKRADNANHEPQD